MHQDLPVAIVLIFLCSGLVASAKLAPEQLKKLPPPATHPVDFGKEVRPILEASCVNCHGHGRSKGGFRLETRDSLLKGGEDGPVVVPGKSAESYLIELVSGIDPDNVMPQKGTRLTPAQVGILRAWIDQGLPWREGVTFERLPPKNLTPPVSPIPVGPEALTSVNGIDLILRAYDARQHLDAPTAVSDRVFARRVYLDTIGLLPTPAQLEEFEADNRPDKRERLVKRLLSDNARYAEHWLSFWNDLLRNDYKGTGYIDDGRKQISAWLYSALATNTPYDRFVAELIDPTPASEGFVKGIVWRGVVNASQTPQMQAAQNISQVFMGVNLKCASCHDSFINDWTLADSYGLASIYADGELEMVRCDKPTGQKAVMKFLYPQLGSIDPKAPKAERLHQLARIVTEKENGRLPRTIVNRLWARLMGRGLVEPLDDMEQPAWDSDLLDWLAADLVANHYDLKKTLERILTSHAYQRPCVPSQEVVTKDFVFRGPFVRRLSAEQFQDALSAVTGVWNQLPESTETDFAAGEAQSPLSELENPARLRWIWNGPEASTGAPPGTVYFRRKLELPSRPTHAVAVVACDDRFHLYVNGKEVLSDGDHAKPKLVDLRSELHEGENVLAIAGTNDKPRSDQKKDPRNPAGLLFYVRIRQDLADADGTPVVRVWDVGSDGSWLCSTNKQDGWQEAPFAAAGWSRAVELGGIAMEPWKVETAFARTLSAAGLEGHVRSALVASDPLMTALGRPNREQVMTQRASNATTLQALELMNGKTLAEELARGSQHLLASGPAAPRDLINRLFERALSRPPTADELKLSEGLVGAPVQKDGVEDLLWSVAMLPEFQLIY